MVIPIAALIAHNDGALKSGRWTIAFLRSARQLRYGERQDHGGLALAYVRPSIVACLATLALANRASRCLIVARVIGQSMYPILHKGDYVLGIRSVRARNWFSRAADRWLLQRGAVVLIRPPAHLGRLEIKRIDAVAGDVRYWGAVKGAPKLRIIPPGQVFLVGATGWPDPGAGRPPADSREYGPCSASAIVARVCLRIWPVARFGPLARRRARV